MKFPTKFADVVVVRHAKRQVTQRVSANFVSTVIKFFDHINS